MSEAAGAAFNPAAAILRAKSPSVGLMPCVSHGRGKEPAAEEAAGFDVDEGAEDVKSAAGVAPAAAILRVKSPSVALMPCVSHGRADDETGFETCAREAAGVVPDTGVLVTNEGGDTVVPGVALVAKMKAPTAAVGARLLENAIDGVDDPKPNAGGAGDPNADTEGVAEGGSGATDVLAGVFEGVPNARTVLAVLAFCSLSVLGLVAPKPNLIAGLPASPAFVDDRLKFCGAPVLGLAGAEKPNLIAELPASPAFAGAVLTFCAATPVLELAGAAPKPNLIGDCGEAATPSSELLVEGTTAAPVLGLAGAGKPKLIAELPTSPAFAGVVFTFLAAPVLELTGAVSRCALLRIPASCRALLTLLIVTWPLILSGNNLDVS